MICYFILFSCVCMIGETTIQEYIFDKEKVYFQLYLESSIFYNSLRIHFILAVRFRVLNISVLFYQFLLVQTNLVCSRHCGKFICERNLKIFYCIALFHSRQGLCFSSFSSLSSLWNLLSNSSKKTIFEFHLLT